MLRVIMIALIFTCVGCSQNTKWPEKTEQPLNNRSKATLPDQYNDYLLLMNDSQRTQFFSLENEVERERFLQAQGLKQKKELNDSLKVDMEKEDVREILGRPAVQENHLSTRTSDWIYDKFNGYQNIKYSLSFKEDKLKEWRVWIP